MIDPAIAGLKEGKKCRERAFLPWPRIQIVTKEFYENPVQSVKPEICAFTFDSNTRSFCTKRKNTSRSAQNVGEMFDRRSLDEVLFYQDHKHRRSIPLFGF
jgi:hypothetical protein